MSCNELAQRLERSFQATTALLQRMLKALEERRTSWASARPSTLRPAPELEQLASQLAEQEQVRATLLPQIAALVPLPPGLAPSDLHLNATRISALLPSAAGRALRAAADAATKAAKAVRTEVTLGERLLRFTRNAHDGLLGQMAAQQAQQATAPGYDRNARLRTALRTSGTAGNLIDGRI